MANLASWHGPLAREVAGFALRGVRDPCSLCGACGSVAASGCRFVDGEYEWDCARFRDPSLAPPAALVLEQYDKFFGPFLGQVVFI